MDEYLEGNTLVMDLIAKHELATRSVLHGLKVAVFATEIASQVALKSQPREGGLGGYYGSLSEDQALRQLGMTVDAETVPADTDPRWLLLRRDLTEIFLWGPRPRLRTLG